MASTRALETITLQCCWGAKKSGRASVQQALQPLSTNRQQQLHRDLQHHHHPRHGGGGGNNSVGEDISSATATTTTAGSSYPGGSGGGEGSCGSSSSSFAPAAAVSSNYPEAVSSTNYPEEGDRDGSTHNANNGRKGTGKKRVPGLEERGVERTLIIKEAPFGRGRGETKGGKEEAGIGATAFALRVADCYSRDDSRTIVRRAGAARVAASALSLLRALLTDCCSGSGGGQREEEERQQEEEGGGEQEEDEEDKSLACCIEEFCSEQVQYLFQCGPCVLMVCLSLIRHTPMDT